MCRFIKMDWKEETECGNCILLQRLFLWQLKVQRSFCMLAAFRAAKNPFSFCRGRLFFIQQRGFIGKCLLSSASCCWQSIQDKTSSRTQISAGGSYNKEKKTFFAHSVWPNKNNMKHTQRLTTSGAYAYSKNPIMICQKRFSFDCANVEDLTAP